MRFIEGLEPVLEVPVDDRTIGPHQGADLLTVLGASVAGDDGWRTAAGERCLAAQRGSTGASRTCLDEATTIE
jgi:hypothetical protein